MTDVHPLLGCLHSMAESFERAEQELSTSPEKVAGWGQFLNVSKKHSQTGPYGTGSGLLVRALAGRLDTGVPDPNGRHLAGWWKNRDRGTGSPPYFVQTLRLAYLYLCARLANVSPVAELKGEIYEELMSRQLKDGLWGDWWLTSELRDPTPRLFTSAIVLLSCGLFRKEPTSTQDRRLLEAANRLEQGALDHPDVPSAYVAAAAAALTSTAGHRVSKGFSYLVTSLARNPPWRIVDQFIYFYEFRGMTGDHEEFRRDYFIVPPAHLLAIAGHQPTAPPALTAATRHIVAALSKNVNDNGGVYRTEPDGLVSSKNQAWSALVFTVAVSYGTTDGIAERLAYSLFRHRASRWNLVEIARVVGLVASTVTLGVFSEGGVSKAFLMVCTLLLSEFYRIRSHIWERRW